MKKVITIICIFVMLLAMTSCNEKTESESKAVATTSTDKTADVAITEDDPILIKFSVTQAASDPMTIYVQEMCDYIEEESDGQIKFEVYPNGELGSLNDVTELISMGSAVMTAMGPDNYTSVAPDMAILNMQYCLTDVSQVSKINESDWFAQQSQLVSNGANVKILSWDWFTGYRQMLSNFEINTPEDIVGKKMRVVDNLALPAFANSLDCTPVVTPWSEVYTSMSNKMIDFAEAPLATLYASSLYEVGDHIAITNHLTSVTMTIMPQELFESMSPELQDLMIEASKKYGAMFSEENLNSQEEIIKKFEEKGVTFTYPNVDSFAEKASKMYENIGYEDMYKTIQDILK